MAEIKKTKTRMYDPWGYQEENNYDSSENQFEIELNELFASATYDDSDKKIHFFNNDGKEISGSSIDTTQFAGGSIIKRAYYDPETKEIVIEFENGDVVKIDAHDLIDEYEFGNGLQIDGDGNVSILVDGSGEPYLSVSESGIKISGVDNAIATAVAAEKARAEQAEADLQAAIEAEGQRAQDAETALNTKINQEIQDRKDDVDAEETRATAAEAAEKARAEAAETVLSQQITALNSELDAEESIREAADVALGRRIDQEIADRKADVDAEEARATSAETAVNVRVDNLINELQPLLNDTLVTTNDKEAALGKYNVSNTSEDASGRTIFSIGNGTADDARSNALEVRENGDVYMWVEGDYMQINRLLAMLAHEVYDDDNNSNG